MCDGSEAKPKAETAKPSSSFVIPIETQLPVSQFVFQILGKERKYFSEAYWEQSKGTRIVWKWEKSETWSWNFKWRIHIQKISDGQSSVKHYLVHVVKEGETLTSIAKQYGVSIYAIAAANGNILDVDLVYEGQHLNIPSAAKNIQSLSSAVRSWSANFKLPDRIQGCLNISNGVLQEKNFTMLYSCFVPHVYPSYYRARNIACFLVMVPILAFCIRLIVCAIHARASREFRYKGTSDSGANRHRSGGGRWKSALGEAWGPDVMDAEPTLDSSEELENHSENQDQISYEEDARAYRKLEQDYQEFLAKCGMSKFGYWRGGSPR